MSLWKTFKDGELVVPVIGRRVHTRDSVDDPCCAAQIIAFNSGVTVDDGTTINANLITFDPTDGTQIFASGYDLSGVDGPTFPNWHYSSHSDLLVP